MARGSCREGSRRAVEQTNRQMVGVITVAAAAAARQGWEGEQAPVHGSRDWPRRRSGAMDADWWQLDQRAEQDPGGNRGEALQDCRGVWYLPLYLFELNTLYSHFILLFPILVSSFSALILLVLTETLSSWTDCPLSSIPAFNKGSAHSAEDGHVGRRGRGGRVTARDLGLGFRGFFVLINCYLFTFSIDFQLCSTWVSKNLRDINRVLGSFLPRWRCRS